jgi:protease I
MNDPKDKRAVALVANGFEQVELVEPRDALIAAGIAVDLVSLKKEKVRAWNHKDWGDEFDVDLHIEDARIDDYALLLLPGGVMNPDFLRLDERAVDFVRRFVRSGKPVAAICHAPWTLIEADVVRGKRMTAYPSLKTDLRNAGADWVDEEVVTDGNLITSRRPHDLPAFCDRVIKAVHMPAAHHAAE